MLMKSKIFSYFSNPSVSNRELDNVFLNCAVDSSTIRCITVFFKGIIISFGINGSRMTLLSHHPSFVKELDLMNIMAAGSKTKVQDVKLKYSTCPVCFS